MADGPVIIEGTFTVREANTSPIVPPNLAKLRQDFQSDSSTRERAIAQWAIICDQVAQLHQTGSLPNPSLKKELETRGVSTGWLEPSTQPSYAQPGYERHGATVSEKDIVDLFARTFPRASIVDPDNIPVPESGKAAPVVIRTLNEIHELAESIRFSVTGNAHSFAIDQPPINSWSEIEELSKMVRELERDLLSPKTQQWINQA
ncbi:MAG: hypothetical protein UU93_C0003G0056 [Candidatus Amesbacteria bacterium GW2011_GWA2_42_12]|uniref:Uncharacterized protein n=1 Tax=Candidatus Amesbacteria bacterium GW2011_GWA2_42_12 TaxID=1618356 RepID=A0A0G1B682_9BACT|nr:MAG: hypothetical protein UU93_C0003G0056 [Candidatus Amesbacteria bacterium GW2011_GWA2_42_12]